MNVKNSKLRAGIYCIIRLLILAFAILIFYNFADYLLPEYIREDQFSFVGALNLFLQLTFCFCLFYGVFIFFELNKFRKKGLADLRNMAFIVSIMNILILLASLFLYFKM